MNATTLLTALVVMGFAGTYPGVAGEASRHSGTIVAVDPAKHALTLGSDVRRGDFVTLTLTGDRHHLSAHDLSIVRPASS